jgi:hypothetical protein
MRMGSVKNKGAGALGIGGGKQHAHRTALGHAEHRGLLAAGSVHYGAHVVHPCLEVWRADHPVGKAGAPLVEQN